MNTHGNGRQGAGGHASTDTRGFDPREWQVQEDARSAQRAGAAPADNAEAQAYARIAQALATPLPDRLPSNFAFEVAQLAARLPRAARLDLRVEQWLVRVLAVAMAVGGAVVSLIYGASWLGTLESASPGGWVGVAAACVLVTAATQGLPALLRSRAG